ncbi:MAG: hypothetical protein RI885_1061 [Actinomycetota bacterium]|jgi:RNA polymerase sigma-70 factor (ECF subfamily)
MALVGTTGYGAVRPVEARLDAALQRTVVPTDIELMSAVALGDRCAFAQLYRRVFDTVVRCIRRRLVDPAQSEEVAQEVLLEVWQTADRFESHRASVITWVATIAHRRAVDRVRASQSSRVRDLRVGIRDSDPEFDHVAEAGEVTLEYRRVRRSMTTLSALHREAIDLVYLDGYTQVEVAGLLGLPLSTVKTRVRDGLARLRRDLDAAPVACAERMSAAQA